MDKYDEYFDYICIIKSHKNNNKKYTKERFQDIKNKKSDNLIRSLKLKKNKINVRKNMIRERIDKYIDKFQYENIISDCECSLDDCGYCYCNCGFLNCSCEKLWYDEYDQGYYEFKSMFKKFMKKQKNTEQDLVSVDIFKSKIINFFCERLPIFFKIKIYGDTAMSMISKIKTDCIDLMFYDFNELKKFILIMERIIREYDKKEISYILYADHWFSGKIKRWTWRYCVRVDTICDVTSCIYNINNIEIRFNVNMKNINGPYLGFCESKIMWGKIKDLYDPVTAKRMGNDDKLYYALYQDEKKTDDNIRIIKQNLINKNLTLSKYKFDNDTYLIHSKINMIKYYYEKIIDGYNISGECPVKACICFGYTFKQFDNIIHNVTKMNSNVIYCIYDYLLKINTNDICTFCKVPFNVSSSTLLSSQSQDNYYSNIDSKTLTTFVGISPTCDCGEKSYIPENEFKINPNTPSQDIGNEYGFDIYCGKKENPNNIFHFDCFIKRVLHCSNQCYDCFENIFEKNNIDLS